MSYNIVLEKFLAKLETDYLLLLLLNKFWIIICNDEGVVRWNSHQNSINFAVISFVSYQYTHI
ncbi:hypothetical protein BLOT_013340 [Blomia tropicalis]|nr:hypothetical protein BLOT_013340 [Blomia tropicalis]